MKRRSTLNIFTCAVLLAATAGAGNAQTYISAEAIPAPDIVGADNLAKIEGIGYGNMDLWTQRLLSCNIVQDVINVLSANHAIRTIVPFVNTTYR